jgi:hypothetical protein
MTGSLPTPETYPDLLATLTARIRDARLRTVAVLVALQAEYVAWQPALPDSLRNSATAGALQTIVDLDLGALTAIVPPRGYGRD